MVLDKIDLQCLVAVESARRLSHLLEVANNSLYKIWRNHQLSVPLFKDKMQIRINVLECKKIPNDDIEDPRRLIF